MLTALNAMVARNLPKQTDGVEIRRRYVRSFRYIVYLIIIQLIPRIFEKLRMISVADKYRILA